MDYYAWLYNTFVPRLDVRALFGEARLSCGESAPGQALAGIVIDAGEWFDYAAPSIVNGSAQICADTMCFGTDTTGCTARKRPAGRLFTCAYAMEGLLPRYGRSCSGVGAGHGGLRRSDRKI